MITKKIWTIISVFMVAMSMSASAATVFDDNFESYTDSAAFQAAWTVGAGVTPNITLQTATGDGAQGSNKFVVMPASPSTERRVRTFPAVNLSGPGGALDISLTGYVRSAAWNNTRSSFGIRDSAAGAGVYAHIGTYNAATSNGTGGENKWVGRFLGLPGFTGTGSPANQYYTLLNGPDKVASVWTKLTVTISHSSVRFFIDDVEDTTDAIVLTGPATTAFGSVNLGWGVTTTSAFNIDSITVNTTTSNVNDWNMY